MFVKFMAVIFMTAIISTEASTAAVPTPNICPMIGQIARSIMTQRQNNAPIDKLMAMVDEVFEHNAPENSLAKNIVLQAYAKPKMSVMANMQNMIDQFANDNMTFCYMTQQK